MILEGLVIADEPDVWRGLGFALGDDAFAVGGVTLRLAGRRAGKRILGWTVRGLDSSGIGLVRSATPCSPAAASRRYAAAPALRFRWRS